MRPYRVSTDGHLTEEDVSGRQRAEKRRDAISSAIGKTPGDAQLYVNRSEEHAKLRRYDLAIQDLETAMKVQPDRTHNLLGLRHRQHIYTGDLQAALADIEEAVRLAPPGFSYARQLAYVYQRLDRIDDAVKAMKDGVQRMPDSWRTWLESAEFFTGLGRREEALDAATGAINARPDWTASYSERALIYAKLGRFREALRDCEHCLKAEPKDSFHYSTRAKVYDAMGKHSAAQRDRDKFMAMRMDR